MLILTSLGCTLLFGVGHMFRDGWPPLGSTHAARLLGGVTCGLGALLIVAPLIALLVGVGIWTGYYADMKHGEGGGPWNGLGNIKFLLLSGITSLIPIAVILGVYFQSAWLGLLVLAGLTKPPIWYLAWKTYPWLYQKWWWFEPTRIAAVVFGMIIGLLITAL